MLRHFRFLGGRPFWYSAAAAFTAWLGWRWATGKEFYVPVNVRCEWYYWRRGDFGTDSGFMAKEVHYELYIRPAPGYTMSAEASTVEGVQIPKPRD